MFGDDVEFEPLSFIIIGAGQVVSKYWIRASREGLVRIVKIVGLESEDVAKGNFGNGKWNYEQTRGTEQTIEIISKLVKNKNVDVALVIPPRDRLEIIKALSDEGLRMRVFVEKPYADNLVDLDEYKKLITEDELVKFHFAGKYANGRANILYGQLPKDKLPLLMEMSLIEGSEYYQYVIDRIWKEGTHPYLEIGPELDLGFHLLDIGSTWARTRGRSNWKLIEARELSDVNKSFGKGFGVSAKLELEVEGYKIEVLVKAGKGDVENERFVKFRYDDGRVYIQNYSVGSASDPVFVESAGLRKELARHKDDYNYYASELRRDVFANQLIEECLGRLEVNEICLRMKEMRLARDLSGE